MSVPLSHELRARFHVRSLPLRKGDTVRVLSGSFVGREERVAKVDRRGYAITLDNVTLKAADEKLKPLALRPAHLVITRLNLSDPWRRRGLRVRDEEVTPEERGEAPTEEVATPPTEEAPSSGEAEVDQTAPEPTDEPPEAAEEPEETEEEAEPTAPAPKSPRPRTRRASRSDDEEPPEEDE